MERYSAKVSLLKLLIAILTILTTNYNQEPKSKDYQQKIKYQQK